MRPDRLRFGTAGIPLSTPKPATTREGISHVRMLGLDAMELEFVHSIFLKKERAPEIGTLAREQDVLLTAHAPYYINLNSSDEKKRSASAKRILDTARVAHAASAYSITYHPGFFMKESPDRVFERIRTAIRDIERTLEDEGVDIWVRPETTGKPTQFGDINEILAISEECERVMPCIDFAHLHARSNGAWNSLAEFRTVFETIEQRLGSEGLANMHVHFSGIAYAEKGEKHHLPIEDSDFRYDEWVHVLREFKPKGVFISESPNIEQDALLIQKSYRGKR